MSSVAGAETAGTSSAATSATTPSARPASRETSVGRNSQISSTLVRVCINLFIYTLHLAHAVKKCFPMFICPKNITDQQTLTIS